MEELRPAATLCEALVTQLWCDAGGARAGPGPRTRDSLGRRFPGELLRRIRLRAAGDGLRRGSPFDLRNSRARIIRPLQRDP